MNKVYPNRINWENFPSDETPINETNLNKMDYALYELDDEVISLDTTKASKIEVAPLIANVTFDETTGIFTFTKKDGSTFTLDTLLEKVIVNFNFDRDTQKIILIMEDETREEIDLSAFITEYEFVDSGTIAFTLLANHTIKAQVKTGSITEDYLQPNYLADIKVAQAKAEAAKSAAETAKDNAEDFAKEAEAHAVGQRGGVDVGEDDPTYHNNSKYYAEKSASDGEAWAKGTRGGVPVPETDETYHNSAEYWAGQAQAAAQGGVVSFNGRNGIVNPEQDDYTITQIKATGTTGQVPTLNAQGKLEMQDPQGGSSGHTILNSEGTALTQRDNLQFVGATVTDDSTNEKTIVNMDSLNLPQIEYEVWKDLPDEEKEKDQIVLNPPSTSGGDGASQAIISDEYDSTKQYTAGDYFIYNNTLYKVTEDTTGEFDETKCVETTVGEELRIKPLRAFTGDLTDLLIYTKTGGSGQSEIVTLPVDALVKCYIRVKKAANANSTGGAIRIYDSNNNFIELHQYLVTLTSEQTFSATSFFLPAGTRLGCQITNTSPSAGEVYTSIQYRTFSK